MPELSGRGHEFLARTPLAAMLVDPAGRTLAANDRLHELLGYDPPELIGIDALALVHPDDLDDTTAALAETAARHHPAAVEARARVRHRTDRWLDLLCTGVNLLDEHGFAGILVTVRASDPDPAAVPRRRGWFEAVVSGTDDIVQVVDEDGRFLWASGPVEKLLGIPAEALVGLTIEQVGNPEHPELTKAWFEHIRAMPGTHPPIIGHRHLLDRTPLDLEVRATNLLHDPEVRAIVLMSRDISERVAAERAEASVRRTEERWLTISKHAHELVTLVDEEATVLWAGPGFATVLGVDPGSLAGRSIRDLVHPDDRARPGGLDDLLTNPGGRYEREYRLRHGDGGWRVFDVEVRDLRGEPAIGAFLVTGRDITARVAAEEANRRLATAIESAGAAVVLTDVERRVLTWNKEAERLSGQRAEDVIGRRLDGGDAPGLDDVRSDVFARPAEGATVTYETERVRSDGTRLPLSVTASPVLDAAGHTIGYSYISFDITQQRAHEQEREARAAQATVVAELGQRALAGASLQDVLDEACELAAATIDIPHAHVLLLSPDGRFHELAAAMGSFGDRVGRRDPVELRGWVRSIDRRRRPAVVEDFEADDAVPRPAAFEGTDLRSGVLCAIDGRDGPIGFFAVLDERPRTFPEAEVAFLQAIANVLATAIDRSRVSDEMQRRALHDELTGLPNRALLLDRLAQAVARLDRRQGTVGLLFIDLDRFKRVNDTLGHRAGDDVLVATAHRLLDAVRLGDTVARTGGDEFLVLTEEIDEPLGAVVLAERIARAIAEPVLVDGHGIHVTASVGVAVADAASDPEELIRDADLAMYRAKQDGRARIQIFDNSMRDEAMTRMAMEESLRSAVAADGVRVVFQPQVRLADGAVVGIEALARWDHPRLGKVPPDAFVGLAEEIGVLDVITKAVLRAACEAASACRAYAPNLCSAVNLTARQLGRRHVVDLVDEALADYDLPPEALVVEVTETAALDDAAAQKILAELRDRGVRVSVDDFGTGYSSLARVTRLPVDEVKIDRTFVNGVADDQGCAAVVSATVTLARVLGLRLVAEGVERDDQCRRLLELGCTEGQGWLFSGPLEHDELLRWLRLRPPPAAG